MQTTLDSTIIDQIPILVMLFNEDLVLEYVGGLPLRIHHLERSALVGQPAHKVQRLLPVAQKHIKRCLTGESFAVMIEFHKRIFEVTYGPLNSADAQKRIACLALDVTARTEAEKTLVDQQAHLSNASRLVALGEVAGGMAHEINNPITIIMGNCGYLEGILKKTPFDQEKALERLEKIKTTADRISKIIRSLLKMSRGTHEDSFKQTDLPELIGVCIDIMRERFHQNRVALSATHTGPTQCICQSTRISQAVINLLTNALDASAKHESPWVTIETSVVGDETVIRITDSGQGIPVDLHQKIFQPFFTTKDINQGTGIGLSLVKSVVEQHGGLVAVDAQHPNTSFVLSWKNSLLMNKSPLSA